MWLVELFQDCMVNQEKLNRNEEKVCIIFCIMTLLTLFHTKRQILRCLGWCLAVHEKVVLIFQVRELTERWTDKWQETAKVLEVNSLVNGRLCLLTSPVCPRWWEVMSLFFHAGTSHVGTASRGNGCCLGLRATISAGHRQQCAEHRDAAVPSEGRWHSTRILMNPQPRNRSNFQLHTPTISIITNDDNFCWMIVLSPVTVLFQEGDTLVGRDDAATVQDIG